MILWMVVVSVVCLVILNNALSVNTLQPLVNATNNMSPESLGMITTEEKVLHPTGQNELVKSSSTYVKPKTKYNKLIQVKYHLRKEGKNWFDAYESCRREGKRLATPLSHEDFQMMRKLGEDSEYVWIAGMKLHETPKQKPYYKDDYPEYLYSHQDFRWMTTGTSLVYTRWAPGEPNNSPEKNKEHENCLVYIPKYYGVSDWACDLKEWYLCEEYRCKNH